VSVRKLELYLERNGNLFDLRYITENGEGVLEGIRAEYVHNAVRTLINTAIESLE
jgi:hypothetical protein